MNGGDSGGSFFGLALFGAAFLALNYFVGYRTPQAVARAAYNPDEDAEWQSERDRQRESALSEQQEREAARQAEIAELLRVKGDADMERRVEELVSMGVVEYKLSQAYHAEGEKLTGQAEDMRAQADGLRDLAEEARQKAEQQDAESLRLFEEVWEERSGQIADSFANAGSGSSPISSTGKDLGALLEAGQAMLDEVNALVSQGERLEASRSMEKLAELSREISAAKIAEAQEKEEGAGVKVRAGERDHDSSREYALMGDRYFEMVKDAREERDARKTGDGAGAGEVEEYEESPLTIKQALEIENQALKDLRADPGTTPQDLLIQLKNLEALERFAILNEDRVEREDRATEWEEQMEARREEARRQDAERREDSTDDDGWTSDGRRYASPPDELKDEVVEIERQALDAVRADPGSTSEDIQQAEQNLADATELYGEK